MDSLTTVLAMFLLGFSLFAFFKAFQFGFEPSGTEQCESGSAGHLSDQKPSSIK